MALPLSLPHNRQRHEIGLGGFPDTSLSEARDKATEKRSLLAKGTDPLKEKRAEVERQKLEQAKVMTFRQCATAYIAAHSKGWRNAKHAAQWPSTLETYAYPVFGDIAVAEVDVALVTKVLEPIWATKTETARRVRGRIESVLDWAAARKYRTGENPARWRGHLEKLLAEPSKIQKVEHHAALPYEQIGAFFAELKTREGMAALAFQFLILTATRTSETINAQWREFDLQAKVWTIPAERMKANREHRVPLSPQATAILAGLAQEGSNQPDAFVFHAKNKARALSNMALLALLKRMGRDDLTAHGFRSTFRDWAAEATNFPRDVAEMALAHSIGDKVEAAYRRGDLFEKRSKMMTAWGNYCTTPRAVGNVTPINKRA